MTRPEVKAMRKELEAALAAIEKKHGYKITIGNMTYKTNGFTAKLEGESTANGRNPDKEIFEANCFRFGIPHTWFGKELKVKNTTYKIVGIKPRSRKYPLLLQNVATGITDTQIPADYARSILGQ